VTRWHELVPKRGARTTWRHKLVLKQGSGHFGDGGVLSVQIQPLVLRNTESKGVGKFKREWEIGKGWP
jgi:hypothetical protein